MILDGDKYLEPNLVLWADSRKTVLLAKLTVPWESNMEWAYERKLALYADLNSESEDRGWTCHVYPAEVGCCGFTGRSVIWFLTVTRVASRARRSVRRQLPDTMSAWIHRCCDKTPPTPPPWWLLSKATWAAHVSKSYWNRLQKETHSSSLEWGMPSSVVNNKPSFFPVSKDSLQ